MRVLDVLQREGYIRGYAEEALGQHKGLRIELRDLANKGLIPGVTKSSW